MEAEPSTTRIVLLVVSIVLWLVVLAGYTAMEPDEAASRLIAVAFISLLLSFVVRTVFRLIRRRPVTAPAWTPGLFFGAAAFAVLSAAGQAGNEA